MLPPVLLAQLSLSDSEVTFLKFLGYLLPLLWATYLILEIIGRHKPDPTVSLLVESTQKLTETVTKTVAESHYTKSRIEELRNMQIRDTDAIFRRLDEMQTSFIDALRQHDRELGVLEGQTKTPTPRKS